MSKELVIASNRHETKVAVLEEDQLVEVYFQRANEYSLAGSIHKGRVTRVLPGMQSAFVDLGLERDTFLYVSDFFEEHDDIDTVSDEKPVRGERRDRGPGRDRDVERPADRGAERGSEPAEAALGRQESPAVESVLATVSPVNGGSSEHDAGPEIRDNRPAERPDGDRGNRGDRRGRRSRRSRSRGRGFPENKYAQPSALQSTTETAPSASVEDKEEEDAPQDVIILPGESLAKYRKVSQSPERVEVSRSEASPSEIREQIEESYTSEEQEPEERVEEIELSDAVLAHHPETVEESIVEPPSTDASDNSSASLLMVKDLSALETEAESAEELEAEETTRAEEEAREEAHVSLSPTPIELESAEAESEDFAETATLAEKGFEQELPESEPLSETSLEEELSSESGPASPAEAGSDAVGGRQTAFVREQGGQSMHRMSRRMRRRRGGNRFHNSNQEVSSAESSTTVVGPVVAGAATARIIEARPEVRPEPREDKPTSQAERALPSITDLLKAGQEIIVQIAKEPLGQKGARITSHIALPGRYVVFMPSVNHLGVSRKVASEEERQRLKKILQKHRVGTAGGFIVRTAGEGVPEEEIAADMNFLYNLWLDIRQKAEKRPAPVLLHYDLDVVQRILRDQVTDEFKAVWVDNEEMYESVLRFIQRFQPALVGRVKMYTRSAPIFDAFNITQELEKALRPKVWLKSGGYIVINQTEALVAIDINTGKYVGKSNRLEDTIVKTNTEAVKEIVRQIRLRDLGGIIVVDFIDMDERKNRQKVMQALEEAMRADKAPYKILQFNDFGLVAITRKRVKQSLERTLCAPCPYCEGAGYVKSVQTIVSEILVEAQKISRAIEGKDVVLRVHPDVAKVLKANSNRYLEELEEILGRPVLVAGDGALHHEKFDLG